MIELTKSFLSYLSSTQNPIIMKHLISILVFSLMSTLLLSQHTGFTPWENCFGKNASCGYYGCSDIKVTTSASPIVAIVKRNGKVKKHAYISAYSSYTFEMPNGTYQVFFYYGENWSRNKKMNSSECYSIYGGFLDNEFVSKDNPITLQNQIMEYTLTRVSNGNFAPKSSSINEAL